MESGKKNGDVETLLGALLAASAMPHRFRVASKANPNPPLSFGAASVKAQFAASLKALRLDKLHVYYLHMPDVRTPIAETLAALDELHKAGGFAELGLSNYPAWMVADIYHRCAERGYVRPSVYQGMYNALTRHVEPELFPCLRKLKMRFYAYNPVAGGLLTDRGAPATPADAASAMPPTQGRFSQRSPNGAQYRARYWNPLQLEAAAMVKEACAACGITVQAAAHRWLAHHSELRWSQSDAIIVGASSVDMLKDNVRDIREGGALPVLVLVAMERAWQHCRPECPTYYRACNALVHDDKAVARVPR